MTSVGDDDRKLDAVIFDDKCAILWNEQADRFEHGVIGIYIGDNARNPIARVNSAFANWPTQSSGKVMPLAEFLKVNAPSTVPASRAR